jgi:signal transduction histidine kinase
VDDEAAGKIQNAAESAADLIQRVGDLVSTLEAQREPEPRDLRPVLEATVRDATDQYESLSVEFDPAEFERRVYAGDLLDSVFTNVLTNAAVHNEGAVTVDLYAEVPAPDRLVVGMADDGSGIDPGLRGEIFEMGVKGPDSEGTGFGLGFVRALTESYGGTVAVGDSDAGGADFRVTLERV